jgi:hypothetical protein
MNTPQKTLETPVGNYRWIENWITIPDSPLGRTNGRTHGVAVLKSGEIVVFHQADPAVLFYSPDGTLLRSWGSFPGAHGLTLVEENGVEYLWLTDEVTKDVVKMSLDGVVVCRLAQPPHSAYAEGPYIPTWVAVAEDRFGGNGEIWVADGYGCSLVHRFDREGNLIGTLDGTEGGGRFNCPHGLALDTRRAEAEFYIADRGNRRFQVYGLDGIHRRTFGADFLNSPDVSARMGEYLVVPELVAGLTILDAADRPAASLGFHSGADRQTGWPNERRSVREGLFNSPHSATADEAGNIYVVEWITGGRVTKLERL